MVEGDSRLGMSSGQRGALGWPGVVDAPNWTLRVVDFSRKALGSLDTCHHFDEGQILTTTDALAFPLVGVCEREVRKAKILGS